MRTSWPGSTPLPAGFAPMASGAVQGCAPACPAICAEKAKLDQWSTEAEMAESVYKPMGQRHVPGHTEVTDPNELRKLGLNRSMLSPSDSEFRAAVFRKNGTEDYVIAFKGTTPTSRSDWWENLKQGSGAQSDYYTRAQRIARRASDKVGKGVSGVSFTGHSLGGGLASAAARATGRHATTFNAAGLHAKTVTAPMSAPIDAVRVKGEILTAIQSSVPGAPEAAFTGKPYLLDPPANVGSARDQSGLSGWDSLAFLFGPKVGGLWTGGKYVKGMAARAIELHGMPAVKDSLKARRQQIAPQARACGC